MAKAKAKQKAKDNGNDDEDDDEDDDVLRVAPRETEQVPPDATAVYRHPHATTLQETPEPGPIDPEWEKPDPKSFSVRREGIPEPEISAFSAGDSEEHGTEFPPRLDALGYPDAMPELKSKILGKPAEPVELPKDATATYRANQHTERKEAASRRGSEIK